MNITIENLSAGYGSKQIIKNISLSLSSGKITGLIGPNGSGKSTLLKCIYRVLTPNDGVIYIDNKKLSTLSYKDSAKFIAVLTQHHLSGFDLTVKNVVLMGRTPYKSVMEDDTHEDYEIAKNAMEDTGTTSMSDLSFTTLSGGEQQRVMLARALAQKTPCLLLDEPTNHLDITYQLQIMDLIRKKELTVVAAIHDLNIAALYCDEIVALQDGKIIAQGPVKEVLTAELIKNLYHVNAKVLERNTGEPAIIYERGKL